MWQTTAERPAVVYDAEESSAMDVWLVEERGFTIPQLMAQAGARVAEAIRDLAREHDLTRVVFLVGPGNNGGDAVVASELLGAAEFEQETWRPLQDSATPLLDAGTLVVDGLFGVGLARPVGGEARRAVEHVNTSPARVLAVDIPSGLSATSGEVVGCTAGAPDGGVAIRAHETITLVGPKAGFFIARGPEHVGRWRSGDIGFPIEEAERWVVGRRAAAAD